jgi:type VI secretion system protein VasJ
LEYLLLALLNDIDADTPCGVDCKYEDLFLKLESEIDKSTSILENIQTDWVQIVENSEYLLQYQTKDIKILCWWTYGLWKQESWSGLEKALKIVNALLQKHEDRIFPKSVKVKISSMTWLEELLNEELLDQNGTISASIDYQVFLDLIVELEKNFTLTVKQETQLFKKIQRALKQLADSKTETQSSISQDKAEIPQVSRSHEIDLITTEADATKVLNSLKKNATLLQNYWIEKDTAHLGAIRLSRLLSWLETDGLPMNDNGKTPLNAPSQESLDEIENLYGEKNYQEALKKIESLISFSPFWLDGHYRSFTILTEMNQSQAALEVKNSLLAYVSADMSILDLTFKDSTPFASLKVKEWLLQNMDVNNEHKQTKENHTSTKESLLESCYVLAKQKKIKEAMSILQNSYLSAKTHEEKFYWRLWHAEFAKEFSKNDISLVLLRELMVDVDRYKLDVWKPELSAKVYSLLLSFGRANIDADEQKSLFSRLCKIDVEQALEIKN